jgi:hypothetical protein
MAKVSPPPNRMQVYRWADQRSHEALENPGSELCKAWTLAGGFHGNFDA